MLIIDPHYILILFFASTILITGCEMRTIQIHSLIFGDYLGTITVDGTFEDANKEVYSMVSDVRFSGSTCTSIITYGKKVYCANVGDSRTILIRAN